MLNTWHTTLDEWLALHIRIREFPGWIYDKVADYPDSGFFGPSGQIHGQYLKITFLTHSQNISSHSIPSYIKICQNPQQDKSSIGSLNKAALKIS
jgi:hypothetical protein